MQKLLKMAKVCLISTAKAWGYKFVYTTGPSLSGTPRTSLVPRPSAPCPVGKLEREKRKEGLVNRHTTSCSSAGMLAELIKT